VGDKTAVRLIQQFGDLAGVQRACVTQPLVKPLTPRLAALIADHADYLQTAIQVSAIRRDVPILKATSLLKTAIPSSTASPPEWEEVVEEWGVRKFAEAVMKPETT
jgi:hypothetical protein